MNTKTITAGIFAAGLGVWCFVRSLPEGAGGGVAPLRGAGSSMNGKTRALSAEGLAKAAMDGDGNPSAGAATPPTRELRVISGRRTTAETEAAPDDRRMGAVPESVRSEFAAGDKVEKVLSAFTGEAPAGTATAQDKNGAQPVWSLPVPTALAGEPLPFFLTAAATSTVSGDGTVPGAAESKPVTGTHGTSELTPGEAKAVEDAAQAFADAMNAAPTKDETDPVYEDWWRASRQRAEERLRTALGWDSFNRLSKAQARELSASIQSGR